MTEQKKRWSKWHIHTGGACPFPENATFEAFNIQGPVTSRMDFAVNSALGQPITYRYKLPPIKTEPFAVTFDNEGAAMFMWSKSGDGDVWLSEAKKRTKEGEGRMLRIYDEDGNLTETIDYRNREQA